MLDNNYDFFSQELPNLIKNQKETYTETTITPVAATSSSGHTGTPYTMVCDWRIVRKGFPNGRPNPAGEIVGRYYKGEVFYIVARIGDWCQLESGNWMCVGRYLSKV